MIRALAYFSTSKVPMMTRSSLSVARRAFGHIPGKDNDTLKTDPVVSSSSPPRSHSHYHPPDALYGGIKYEYFCYLLENISDYMSKVFRPELIKVTKSEIYIELPYSPLLMGNPSVPCLHGGAVATMIDHAGGFCAWSCLNDAKTRVSTADLRIDYLHPAPCELLLFHAKILHKSNKLIRVDVSCYDNITSAKGVNPETNEKTIHLENYQHKRLVASGRGLFRIYKTEFDLNLVLEKLVQAKWKEKEASKDKGNHPQ
jgi:uncharacterized protein (TIGR00369 family)